MLNIVIVGRPRTGKTTYAKRKALELGFPILANDPTGEWGQRPLDLRQFLDAVEARKGQRTTVVWEEATGYLNNVGGGGKDRARVVRALTQRHHYRHVNLLLFHSLRAVPVWVMDYVEHLVLFKTADRPMLMASKFGGWWSILIALDKVRKHPDPHHREQVPIFGA